MIRSSLSIAFALLLAYPVRVHAQSQINPNQIARGAAITTASASQAISFCGSTPACEWHIIAAATVASSVTIPANITLFFEGGGHIAIASGATLAINGSIKSATDTQIFTGAGAVRNLRFVSPAWFGSGASFDQLVATLQDVSGATIGPWSGSILSSGALITRTHLNVKGAGLLPYTADHSQFDGAGSIIQGKVLLNIPDLQMDGVNSDIGSYQAAHGGACTGDASGNLLDIAAAGNTASTIRLTNVATLGCSATTSAHSILIENFDGVYVNNLATWFNNRGFVSKSSHVTGLHIVSHEHSGEGFIVKSDSTEGGALVTGNYFEDVEFSNASAGTGGTINIYADQAPLSDLTILGLKQVNAGGLVINGYGSGAALSGINLTNYYNSNDVQGDAINCGAYCGSLNIVNPIILNPAGSGIWFVGGPVNVTNPLIVNPGSHIGIYEQNGGAGSVTGGRCIQAATACVQSNNGPVLVSNVYSEYPVVGGSGTQYFGAPNGNLMVGTASDLTNYYFGGGDVRQDKSIGVSGHNTSQINMGNTGSSMTNQHRAQVVLSEAGIDMRFLDDAGLNPHDFFACTRSGNTPVACSIPTPLTVPSITSGPATTGSCSAPTGYISFTIGGTAYHLATCAP